MKYTWTKEHWWGLFKSLVLVCAVLELSGCVLFDRAVPPVSPSTRSAFIPPSTFREADLIGQWQNITTIHQVETLMLTADHRFVHVFDMKDGHPTQDHGTWHLEQRASGCVYLHLEGMRYFYGAEAFTLHGNRFEPGGEPYRFWELCEQQRIPMPDKVILTVTDQSGVARGIGLLYPATKNPPDSSVIMELVADANGRPIPTVTPLRP